MRSEKGKDEDPPITMWLGEAQAGDKEALDRVWGMVLGELRELAECRARRELNPGDIQATEIVNEAWIRMHGKGAVGDFTDRGMFFGAVWRVMGQLLVDHGRARGRRKRGGDRRRVPFDFAAGALADTTLVGDDGDRIDAAMRSLADHDVVAHGVAVMRLCFGHDRRDIARIEGLDPTEVDKRWRYARAFLRDQIESEHSDDE